MGAPPIPLIIDRMLSIGRSNDCDLTVPSQRVSRKHAEITWDETGSPILRDLGSQNGTQVNGKRIRGERKLAHGDEVEFGPYLCTYRYVGRDKLKGGGAKTPAMDTNALTQPMMGDAMAGRLDQIELTELLQTLEFNQKTGTLEVFGSDGEGSVILQNGTPVFAQTDDHEGEEAIYQLVKFKNGQFSFSPEVEPQERNVNSTMGSILMEACRRQDEQ